MLSLIQLLMFGLGFWRLEATTVKYPMEAGRLAVLQLLMVFFISLSYLVADSLLSSDAHNALPTASELMAWLQDPHILGMLLWTGVVTTALTNRMETDNAVYHCTPKQYYRPRLNRFNLHLPTAPPSRLSRLTIVASTICNKGVNSRLIVTSSFWLTSWLTAPTSWPSSSSCPPK